MKDNHRWVPLAAALALTGLLLACTQTLRTFSDDQISLRKEPMRQTTGAAGPIFTGKDPGENKVYGRAYYDAQPMIPHNLTDMEISASANDCLDCHEEGDGETPGLPPSHRIKGRVEIFSRDGARQGQLTQVVEFVKVEVVSGNRYNCMLCHALQAQNAKQLVENTFQPEQPSDARKDALDGLNEGGQY